MNENLFTAIDLNEVSRVNYCLGQEININAKNEKGQTPLMLACEKGNLEIIKALGTQMEIDFTLDDGGPNHLTALRYAFNADKNGSHLDVINYLFSTRNLSQEDNNIALIYYAGIENLNKVKECLESKKCDINYYHSLYGTPLISAIENNKIEMVQFLLNDRNIDTNKKNYLNESPLIVAIKHGYIAIAELLIEKSNLHEQSFLLGTPLTAAIYFGHDYLAEKLLAKERTFENHFHPGAFLCAVRRDAYKIVEKMIEKGANINSLDNEGYQDPPYWVWDQECSSPFAYFGPPVFELPVIVAIESNNLKVLRLLLDKNVDLNKKGASGYSASELIHSSSISVDAKKLLKEKIERSTNIQSIGAQGLWTPASLSSPDKENLPNNVIQMIKESISQFRSLSPTMQNSLEVESHKILQNLDLANMDEKKKAALFLMIFKEFFPALDQKLGLQKS